MSFFGGEWTSDLKRDQMRDEGALGGFNDDDFIPPLGLVSSPDWRKLLEQCPYALFKGTGRVVEVFPLKTQIEHSTASVRPLTRLVRDLKTNQQSAVPAGDLQPLTPLEVLARAADDR